MTASPPPTIPSPSGPSAAGAPAPRRTARRHRDLSLPIGRVAGIPIRLHVTLVALLVLLALGSTNPEGPGVAESLLWPALVFGSVVVHELAHSLVAVRRGVPVAGIVLLPIGGISKMSRLPDRPRDELVIAAVGPAASVTLGLAAALAVVATGHSLTPVSFNDGSFAARLAWVNLMLAGFNLIPAFPLDGGRVLRAWLAERSDLESATRRAASLGWVLGSAMIAVGFVSNVWLMIIGIFVLFGGAAEEAATIIHARLQGKHVSDAMHRSFATIDDAARVSTARDAARAARQPVLPVTHDGRYTGVLDMRDATMVSPTSAVAPLVDHDAPPLRSDEALDHAVEDELWPSGHPALAVVDDDGRVIGLLGNDDVADVVERSGPDHPR
jgi:Zn-dependent protease